MNTALILAGGSGSRMKADIPKQYIKLCGIEILKRTVLAFTLNKNIDRVAIICDSEYYSLAQSLSLAAGEKLLFVKTGGKSRTESSYIGIKALNDFCSAGDIVLIHDAARPFITDNIITDCINSATKYGGCITAVPVTDTIAAVQDGFVYNVPERAGLFSVQTPQAFRFTEIKAAYDAFNGNATDDATVYAAYGKKVYVVSGDYKNIKITTPLDILTGELIINKKL